MVDPASVHTSNGTDPFARWRQALERVRAASEAADVQAEPPDASPDPQEAIAGLAAAPQDGSALDNVRRLQAELVDERGKRERAVAVARQLSRELSEERGLREELEEQLRLANAELEFINAAGMRPRPRPRRRR